MSYLTGYTVKLRDWTDEYDITEYAMSFMATVDAKIGDIGSATCAITLNNQTGEFTPYEVGGQGTYSNFDLFTLCLTIEATVSTTPSPTTVPVFDGVIRNVVMSGNVYDSKITLICDDWMRVASGTPADTTQASSAANFDDAISRVVQGTFSTNYGQGLDAPYFGAASPSQQFQVIPLGPVSTSIQMPATSNTTAHDLLANTVLPAGPFVTWPGGITFTTSPTQIQFDMYVLDRTLTRTYSVTDIEFGFDISGFGIPITDMTIGYNTDLITSTTSVTSGLTGSTTQTASNATTSTTYGGRSRTYANTANASDADAANAAGFWTNRQATARALPLEIKTTIPAIDAADSANANQIATLLDYRNAPFQVARATYTATGGTNITTDQITVGRSINAVPGATTITVRMLPAADYQSFVLDSSVLGVLDQNRLG